MSDLIRREEAIKCLDGNILITGRNEAEAVKEYFEMVVSRLEALPTADPKVGKWIEEDRYDDDHYIYCSVCGDEYIENDLKLDSWVKTYFKYCPNCGAKMERSDDEHTD